MKEKDQESKIILSKFDSILEKLPKSRMYSSSISSILDDILQFEMGFDHAILDFYNSNDYVELEVGWTSTLKKKFSRILFIDRLIHSSGMFEFREQIMELEIENLFGVKKERRKNDDLPGNFKFVEGEKC